MNIHTTGVRLKEERERLGLTQPEFAEVAGVKKRALIDWEKGVSSPTAVQMSALAGIGVDVLYVVTGQRSFVPPPAISPEVRELIDHYEGSSQGDKAAIRQLAKSVARSGESAAGSVARSAKETADTPPAQRRALAGRK